MSFSLTDHPHRRFNPLSREWVLVSPHRAKRPWQGQTHAPSQEERPAYDPGCYLCPGNTRANGERNPDYPSVYVFDNDFAALLPDTPEGRIEEHDLFLAHSERGICKVICFTPAHNLTLPRMTAEQIARVVEAWTEQYAAIGAESFIQHVQIFENKGEIMGCSNPHPHGQIWANESIPMLPSRELESQRSYHEAHGRSLLCDYGQEELRRGERVVCETGHFLTVVPFWATWPFELLLFPKEPRSSLLELSEEERVDLALHLKLVTTTYDNLFQVSFPYSMGIHQSPTDGQPWPGCQMHLHFYPPLLRSAEVRKYMVGYELLAEPQRDITPETAAQRLREVSGPHYLSPSE